MGLYVGNKFLIKNSDFIVNEGSSTGIGTTENKKIKASDAGSADQFGYSVAVGSDRIVVGAFNNNVTYNNQGSAYIFDLDGNQVGILTASIGQTNQYFGNSVAVGSGKIVIGSDGFSSSQGAAYIYDLDGSNENRITAFDGAASDNFGYSVAVGCGRIVIGSYDDHVNSIIEQGSAYIYDLDGNLIKKIIASDGGYQDRFGRSVSVGCGRIVVGSNDDDNGNASGSAYIFDLNGNQLTKITASDGAASDAFGDSVAVGCGRIVVGAPYDDVGINTNQGSAYIYDLDGNNEVKITASDGAANDWFGGTVAVGCGRIVVGAYRDESITGSAYVFDLDGNQLAKINASEGDAGDSFGISVAVGNGRIVAGAHFDYGVGNQEGSAYIWEIDETLSDYYDEIVDNYRY